MPLNSQKSNIPWARWIGEFVVIVLGILGAMGVDEYREIQNDREREQEYLSSLNLDLQSNIERLTDSGTKSIEGLARLEYLLEELGVNLEVYYFSPELEEYGFSRTQLSRPTWLNLGLSGFGETFIPSSVTYNTLLSTGDLRIISDTELRRAIPSYYGNLEYRVREMESDTQLVQDYYSFLLQNNIDIYDSSELVKVSSVPGLIPYLANARDSMHWRSIRFIRMKEETELLLNQLNSILVADR